MNTDHRFDELLRQKLGGYRSEPSPGLWEGITGRLPGAPIPPWRAWLNTLLLPVTILVLTGGVYLFSGNRPTEARPIASDYAKEQKAGAVSIERPGELAEAAPARTEQPTPRQEARPAAKPEPDVNTPSIITSKPKPEENKPLPTTEKKAEKVTEVSLVLPVTQQHPVSAPLDIINEPLQDKPAINTGVSSALASNDPLKPYQDLAVAAAINMPRSAAFRSTTLSWSPSYPTPFHNFRNEATSAWQKGAGSSHSRQSIRPIWSLGLFYIPEIYHSEDLHAERTLYGFDGMMRYTWYNYTLEFGMGISRVRNENLYTVDYNAYLGTYKDLDSIAFQVDTINQTVVPLYFFNEVKVYDSTTSQYFDRTVNTYTYLQFPLMLGYRHPLGRTTLSLRGGPMLSVLVGSQEPQIFVDNESDRILRIDDRTPGRIRTNWQFLMNAGVTYALTSRLSLSVEPGIRYYLNPIYQEASTKPWSASVRTGIIYEFGVVPERRRK